MKERIILNNYIKTLLENERNSNTNCLQDLYSKSDYERLLNPVIELINTYPTASFLTLKEILFNNSHLKELIKTLIEVNKITPGLVLTYGTDLTKDTIVCGLKQEYLYENNKFIYKPEEMENDTIFDLASTSKIFTCLAILKLEELNLIDLYKPINYYVPEFKELNDVTIYDLLKFRIPIGTDIRVDKALNKEEAKEILYTTKRREKEALNAYTDMGCMVLRCVVEKQAKCSFYDFIKDVIFSKVGMENTFLNVPRDLQERVANENYSIKINEKGEAITEFNNPPGTVHDAKARAIGAKDGISPGSAGYFSCANDMLKLAKALIEEKIITKESLYSIADNAVGLENNESDYTWFYGSLVYLKQPSPTRLGVHHPLSGKAFLVPGFTGNSFCVDPLNRISLFLGSNRLHNRIYDIHPSQRKKIINNPINHQKTFILPNNEEKIISMDFTKYKEVIVKAALNLSLQYKLLELIYKPEKEKHLVRELN